MIAIIERQLELVCDLSNGAIFISYGPYCFNCPRLFDAKLFKKQYETWLVVTTEYQLTHALLNGVIANDLE